LSFTGPDPEACKDQPSSSDDNAKRKIRDVSPLLNGKETSPVHHADIQTSDVIMTLASSSDQTTTLASAVTNDQKDEEKLDDAASGMLSVVHYIDSMS